MSIQKIPMASGLVGLFRSVSGIMRDWRDDWSWGRTCAVVALVKAWKLSDVPEPNVTLVSIWLGIATGSYGFSKVTEMVCSKRTMEAVPPPGGDRG